MPVYIQDVPLPLQGDTKCIESNSKSKSYKDTSSVLNLNIPNAGAAKRSLPPFQPPKVGSIHDNNLPKPMHLTQLQSKFINDTMKDIREKEKMKTKKRKTSHHDDILSASSQLECNRARGSWTSIFLDRLSSNADVAQIVASSGGLVTYWNESFSGAIARSSKSLRNSPLTIFELIESESLQSLYGMLAMALHRVPIVEDSMSQIGNDNEGQLEDEAVERPAYSRSSDSSHLSITLPCRLFHGSSCRYNITIVFMDDLSSRCFIGILTPSSTSMAESDESSPELSHADQGEEETQVIKTADQSTMAKPILPFGRMLRVYDDVLCQMIFGSD